MQADNGGDTLVQESPTDDHLPQQWQWWQDQGGALLHGGIMNGTLVHGRRKDEKAM